MPCLWSGAAQGSYLPVPSLPDLGPYSRGALPRLLPVFPPSLVSPHPTPQAFLPLLSTLQPSPPSSQTNPNGTVYSLPASCSWIPSAPHAVRTLSLAWSTSVQAPACWQHCPGSLPLPTLNCAQFLECGRHSVNASRPLHTLFPLPRTHFHLPVLSSTRLALQPPPCALLELFAPWGSYLFSATEGARICATPQGRGHVCPRLLALEYRGAPGQGGEPVVLVFSALEAASPRRGGGGLCGVGAGHSAGLGLANPPP